MLNSHLSFKISLPFHTKATTSDFPRHPLFTPRDFQVERENLSIYLGFPGIRQSRARAASARLTSLEAQKEHSEQLHVQGVPVQRSAVLVSQLSCCSHVPDPRQTSQSCPASGMCRTNSHCTDVCHSLDTLACATCTSTHFVV